MKQDREDQVKDSGKIHNILLIQRPRNLNALITLEQNHPLSISRSNVQRMIRISHVSLSYQLD